MLFNSIDFAIFLPVVFVLYWFVTNHNLKLQNALIVISSFVFYGWWDWRFLFLMIGTASIDFVVGILLAKTDVQKKRKVLLAFSIAANIGMLAFFKYFNFFAENFAKAFTLFGMELHTVTLKVVLPVGISFYTFQALSYSIDVYRNKLKPCFNIIDYFAYISFFPQLVAGPIERATNLLPQFYSKRVFDYSKAVDGTKQILWGLFKKMVVADTCAQYANQIFNNSEQYAGSTLVLGALFFTFQIYCDFSGYSDIAIGTARLFGFNLMRNFAFPYFSRDIAEFWRRWHISLSTWFRDYVYIPLGGSHGNSWSKIRNTFVIFLLSGFWHGANWTFIVWGALNAIYFLPLLLANKNRVNLGMVAGGRVVPSVKELSFITLTFTMTVFAWIFFRAESVGHALRYISGIFSVSLLSAPDFAPINEILTVLFIVLVLLLIEWRGRHEQYAIAKLGFKRPRTVRWVIYVSIILLIIMFRGGQQEFIYFQF